MQKENYIQQGQGWWSDNPATDILIPYQIQTVLFLYWVWIGENIAPELCIESDRDQGLRLRTSAYRTSIIDSIKVKTGEQLFQARRLKLILFYSLTDI